MESTKESFEVYAWTVDTKNSSLFCHWSEGLKMLIIKDGVEIKLNSREIQLLVKSLPRTVGGTY